jgi:glycosyltransferase involved in cell wall biosynthesis
LTYVLITAARNEEAFIEKTIQSVIAQTILPKKWVIVSDGSTDRTDEIVQRYAKERDWIEFIRLPDRRERHYAGKAKAFNAGYGRVKSLEYDVIGNLDADISFDKDHYEFLLGRFSEMSELGVAGTCYLENDCVPVYSFKDVAGQCQLFRCECFEEIGGYVSCKYGGIDNIAVLTARMKGWETRTFDERTFFHHRPMSTAESNKWKAKMKHGREDYLLGYHPLWELFRITYQMTKKPYLIGGTLLFYGYAKAVVSRMERPISREVVSFQRKEQMRRLKSIFQNLLKMKIRIEET